MVEATEVRYGDHRFGTGFDLSRLRRVALSDQ